MVYKTIQHVFVPNLKLFRPVNTKLQAKEVGEFSITFMAAAIYMFGDFLNFEQPLLSRLLVYPPETCRDLSKPTYQHCVKILSKNTLI